MNIERRGSDETVVRAEGDLDEGVHEVVRRELERAAARGTPRITLDLTEVTGIDLSVLSVIDEVEERLLLRGQQFRLAGASSRVRRQMDLLAIEGRLGWLARGAQGRPKAV